MMNEMLLSSHSNIMQDGNDFIFYKKCIYWASVLLFGIMTR